MKSDVLAKLEALRATLPRGARVTLLATDRDDDPVFAASEHTTAEIVKTLTEALARKSERFIQSASRAEYWRGGARSVSATTTIPDAWYEQLNAEIVASRGQLSIASIIRHLLALHLGIATESE